MIKTNAATALTGLYESTQVLESKNDITTENFAKRLEKQMAASEESTVATKTDQDKTEKVTEESDGIKAIKEMGLVAYIMECHKKRIREEVLELMGITEESLEKMPPEQRTAIEKRITREIQKRMSAESVIQKNINTKLSERLRAKDSGSDLHSSLTIESK